VASGLATLFAGVTLVGMGDAIRTVLSVEMMGEKLDMEACGCEAEIVDITEVLSIVVDDFGNPSLPFYRGNDCAIYKRAEDEMKRISKVEMQNLIQWIDEVTSILRLSFPNERSFQ
jgi:uncharacterized UPF0146 family protein